MRLATAFAATIMSASGILAPTLAEAGLGAPSSSLAVDRGKMNARMASQAMGRFTRHELTRPNGGQVHEYTNADGAVFAVSWSGPGKPDLRALLGQYFTAYQAGNVAALRQSHSFRHPPLIDRSDLTIQASGHMGWFRGLAFVPSLAPSGFVASDLVTP